MLAESRTGMRRHFADGGNCTLLNFEQGSANMQDKVSSVFIFIVRIIECSEVSCLFLLLRRFKLSFVGPNDLNQMRDKFRKSRSKFFFHDFGQVRKNRISKFMKICRISSQPFTSAFHCGLEVGTESVPTYSDGHMSHTF
mmetsp:Transcript_126720/g.364507  ORF Transcript_126720/g.364507 Transcript_126720/m.364507 type:complete len:140 (-) Transcript_126720:1952-2371(-)